MELMTRLERGKLSDAQMSAARDSILLGDCPFCGKAGFKVIVLHISKSHGLPGRAMRELLGFTFTQTICSLETTEKLSAVVNRYKFSNADRASGCGVHEYSSAAKEKLRVAGVRRRDRNGPPKTALTRKLSDSKHGTSTEYSRYGCRCDLCREANTVRHRLWYREGSSAS